MPRMLIRKNPSDFKTLPLFVEATPEGLSYQSIGMPLNFTELGIGVQDEAMLEELADMCTDSGNKKVAAFRPLDREAVLEIYRLANH